jgi:hypothetical protein
MFGVSSALLITHAILPRPSHVKSRESGQRSYQPAASSTFLLCFQERMTLATWATAAASASRDAIGLISLARLGM